jgi:hypothetical protein
VAELGLLDRLLSDRTLIADSGGGTVLHHLSALASCEPDDRRSTMSGPGLALDLIRMLQPEDLEAAKRATQAAQRPGQKKAGHPLPGGLGEITQNTVHYTCGAASAQVWMRLNAREELVRIVHQLHCDGRATLYRDGRLKPARFSLVYHAGARIYANETFRGDEGTEDRCDLDILLQSSLMDKIALGNLSAYDVYSDSGGIWNVLNGNSGSHPMYLKREMERLTGLTWAYQHSLDPYKLGGFARFFGNLRTRTEQGALVDAAVAQGTAGKHFLICFQTNPSDAMALHYVCVVGYDASRRTFYYVDTCEKKEERAKLYPMTRDEMMSSLRCVVYRP